MFIILTVAACAVVFIAIAKRKEDLDNQRHAEFIREFRRIARS